MTTNTGGPAFPIVHPPVEGFTFGGVESYGLTIRDYFAAKALQGFAAHLKGARAWSNETSAEANARLAYEYADAMLKARG